MVRLVKHAGGKVLGGLLRKLPDSVRTEIALKVPRLPVGRPIDTAESAYDLAYFERLYATPDPWQFAEQEVEKSKYALTLDLCGPGPFDRALEVGCSEGVFTELLAPRCRSLLAIDISSRAVARANERLAPYPQADARAAALPAAFPEGPFDLIVASDVVYFWPASDIQRTIPVLQDSLAPGGRLLAIHFTGDTGTASTGDEAHDILLRDISLPHVFSENREIGAGRPYRIDIWEKPTGSSP